MDLRPILISVVMIIFVITYSRRQYLKTHPKKKEEDIDLGIEFQPDPDLPVEIDFGEYAKKGAKELKIEKEKLLEYLINNKGVLLSSYRRKNKREIDDTEDISLVIIKIFNEY